MHRTPTPRFRKTLLALAAGAALAPHTALALDLAQAPPGTTESYVAPNVIISIDDSGSMKWIVDAQWVNGDEHYTTPEADDKWNPKATRINILKYALTQVFNDTALLPDGKIRLAWQAMWNNGNSPNAENVNSVGMQQNSMRPLQGDHRKNFLQFVKKLNAYNGTPSHQMFSQADAYMRRPLNVNSPWAADPGKTGQPYLGCRRNYHIMFTDGGWNGTVSGGHQDNNELDRILPDKTLYGSRNPDLRPPDTTLYSDPHASTLADWAFYSWAVPLQNKDQLTGALQTSSDYRKAPPTENFGKNSAGKDVILKKYWNPRYNPATWPHMVTYTIGFSKDATTWPGASHILAPTEQVPFGYDGSFADLASGHQQWPNVHVGGYDGPKTVRSLDLWHAALNGRGRFYSVTRSEDLEKAFREIIGQLSTQTDPDVTSATTSGTNASRNDVGLYTSAYEPDNAWKGYVKAQTIDKHGNATAAWGGKTTADLLDAMDPDRRVILSWSVQWTSKPGGGAGDKGGVPFRWADDQTYLSTGQNALLGSSGASPAAASGRRILEYLRGDQGLEGTESGGYTDAKPLRERKSRQGDIINSGVWYSGAPASAYALQGYSSFARAQATRTPMLYVGGNDGMLHGFSAADGSEKIAYVPKGAIPALKDLTNPGYAHQYYVDGSPMAGDVDLGTANTPDWRTLLVGTMGAGGKGYFVLDVTNPAALNGSTAPVFSEANAGALVRLDRTRGVTDALNCTGLAGSQQTACAREAGEDRDIGHITAKPVLDENDPMRTTQITRMNNNRWAVVLGNGYNSANQRPVLLIQYLDQAQELLRLPATTAAAGSGNAKDNGLSAPRLIDLNGDGRADIAYAGDNLGNLWKFDLTSDNADQWGVAFGGSPLFTAQAPSPQGSAAPRTAQPITVAPTVRANDRAREVVLAGDGRKSVPVGGMIVAFGTGRNVTAADPGDKQVQTLYSVLDNTRYRVRKTSGSSQWLEVHPGNACTATASAACIDVPAPAALGTGVEAARLAKREIVELTIGSTQAGRVDEVDTLDKTTWSSTYNGWYMHLPAEGERLLKNMETYDGSNILVAYTQVPSKGQEGGTTSGGESCSPAPISMERQYRTMINIMDGRKPSLQLIDVLRNGTYLGIDNGNASRVQVNKGAHSMVAASPSQMVDVSTCTGDKCLRDGAEKILRMPEQSLRPSWRQLQ